MKLNMKLKRIISITRRRMPSTLPGILITLLAFSMSVNVLLYMFQGAVKRKDVTTKCRSELRKIGRCTYEKLDNNAIQKDRVFFQGTNGFTVSREDALLAGEDPHRKVFLTIGLATVERKSADYLSTTLDSLLQNASKRSDYSIKIVVLLADPKRRVRERRLKELRNKYNLHLKQGKIQIITIPLKAYPQLHGLAKTLNNTEDRMYWRSKQTIDFAFLMQYCQYFSPYYLHLEDDVIAERDYDLKMKKFIDEKEDIYWFNLDFSNLGFIGKLYRSETLMNQARLFRLFYTEMPVDLLLAKYRTLMGDDLAKSTYPRNIFQHIGYQSSSLTR